MDKLLIIDNAPGLNRLYGLFKELSSRRVRITLLSGDSGLCELFEEINCLSAGLKPGKAIGSNSEALLHLLLLPFHFIHVLVRLYSINKKYGCPDLLLFGQGGQTVWPLAASILKIRLLIYRQPDNESYPALAKTLIRLFSRWGNYWVLSVREKTKLEKDLSGKARIKVLPLGIGKTFNEQADIFSQMASARREKTNKKFFSVGTVVSGGQNYLEALLNASKACLSVIKELQLIIICGQKTKNQMQWLAKKLEIDPLVWFVGPEALRRKWCENLDIYLAVDHDFSLPSFYHLLFAQSHRLPLIAPDIEAYGEIMIKDESGLLVNMKDPEELAQAMIRLYRDRRLREKICRRADEIIAERYRLDKMADDFIKIF